MDDLSPDADGSRLLYGSCHGTHVWRDTFLDGYQQWCKPSSFLWPLLTLSGAQAAGCPLASSFQCAISLSSLPPCSGGTGTVWPTSNYSQGGDANLTSWQGTSYFHNTGCSWHLSHRLRRGPFVKRETQAGCLSCPLCPPILSLILSFPGSLCGVGYKQAVGPSQRHRKPHWQE